MSTARTYFAIFVAAAVIFSACSNGADTRTQDAVPELSASTAAVIRDGFPSDFSDEQADCFMEGIEANPQLVPYLAAANVGDTSDLDRDDQMALTLLWYDCAPDLMLARNIEAAPLGRAVICQHEFLVDHPDREDYLYAFAASNSDEPIPAELQAPMIDLLVDCSDGTFIKTAHLYWILDDWWLANQADAECLDETMTPELVRPLFEFLIETDDRSRELMDATALTDLLEASSGCVPLDQIIGGRLASHGVQMSRVAGDCINDTVTPDSFAAAFQPDRQDVPADRSAFVSEYTSCLTPYETLVVDMPTGQQNG